MTHKHLSKILSVQSLLIFLRGTSKEFQRTPPKFDSKQVWSSTHQLLTGTVIALQTLGLDAAGSICHIRAKVHREMVPVAPATVRLELMMALTLSPQPVDPRQTKEALRLVPQHVKLWSALSARSKALKPSTAMTSVKQSSSSRTDSL